MWKISKCMSFASRLTFGKLGGYTHSPYISKRKDRLISRGTSYFTEMFEVVVF
jgi:hypothetical protein